MWSLGGLPPPELLRRTARETWEDEIFGQAARLAFYHFIAIFPALLLLLLPLARLAGTGAGMRQLLSASFQEFLPARAAALVAGAIRQLDANAQAGGPLLLAATGSSIWAGINACWAMIVGLNKAYETHEDRSWWEIAKAAVGLAMAVQVLVFAALLLAYYAGGPLRQASLPGILLKLGQWAAIAGILLLSFALFYRFGPNLKRRQWQWSTPGAVFGACLWVGATLLVRFYFDRISTYGRIYGPAAAAAMLLMWLYMTSATVLIGAELNSEIEKGREARGEQQPARRPGTGKR